MAVPVLPLSVVYLRLFPCSKPVPVKVFVSELAVQAFYKGILRRLSRPNKAQLYARFSTPEERCIAGEFCAVVANDFSGRSNSSLESVPPDRS